MDSSRSFENRNTRGPDPPKVSDPILARGHRGGVIPMHRALAHFRLGTMNLITASCLFVFFSFAWLALLPQVCGLWTRIFTFGIRFLPLRAEVGMSEHHWTSFLSFDIPYLRMEPVLPSAQVWWLSCAVTMLIFVATFFISKRLIPVIYLLRGVLLVQVIALLYFAVDSSEFSAHAGQLFGRVRDIWNRVDLTRATHIRFDILHFRFRPAEKGIAHVDYDGPSRAVSSFPMPAASIGTAEDRTVHAGALHCFWHACRRHDCDRLLLLGNDLVV